MEPDDIDELARRAKAGDRDALEALLTAVRPRTLAISPCCTSSCTTFTMMCGDTRYARLTSPSETSRSRCNPR